MMLKSLVIACGLVDACSIPSNAQELNMYDSYGNNSYGYVNPGGSLGVSGPNGNYSYGYVSHDGSVNMSGPNGTFSYGYVNPDGTGYIYGQ
jgi:hypothetical protein